MHQVILKDRQAMYAPKIVLDRRFCITLAYLSIFDSEFLDVLKTLLTFAKTVELESDFNLRNF